MGRGHGPKDAAKETQLLGAGGSQAPGQKLRLVGGAQEEAVSPPSTTPCPALSSGGGDLGSHAAL